MSSIAPLPLAPLPLSFVAPLSLRCAAAAKDGRWKEEGGAIKVLWKRGGVGRGRLGQGGPAGNGGVEGARLGLEAGTRAGRDCRHC